MLADLPVLPGEGIPPGPEDLSQEPVTNTKKFNDYIDCLNEDEKKAFFAKLLEADEDADAEAAEDPPLHLYVSPLNLRPPGKMHGVSYYLCIACRTELLPKCYLPTFCRSRH